MERWILKFASYKTPDDIFNFIVSDEKTIETRPHNPKSSRNYANIKPGDTLVFKSLDSGKVIEKEVNFVHVYPSVKDMVYTEDVSKIFPGVNSPEELLSIYDEVKKKWGKAYAMKLEQHGIVAIGFR